MEDPTMSHLIVQEDQAPYQSLGNFPLTLRVNDSFEEFVRLNPDLVVEQNSNGEIVIKSPTGGESSERNAELTFQLRAWSKHFGGVTFDSSVIFCLPDGSKRSSRISLSPHDGPKYKKFVQNWQKLVKLVGVTRQPRTQSFKSVRIGPRSLA
jgi:Uma2 family endonuclease